jgi:branched-chain amino acid transport system ATP-binding protein
MIPMLNIKDLRAYYGQVQALHGLTFSLNEGSLTTLLGANGAGKTTTLRAICHMVRSTGAIEFEGKPLSGRSTENIVRLGIAHVPQGRGTFTTMTVEENLQLGAITRSDRKNIGSDIERMYDHFPVLKQRYAQQAGTLSGGEQQMLAVARALMLRPRLMLIDEPSFGLAPLVVRDLFGILGKIPRGQGDDPGGRAKRPARARARRPGLRDRNRTHRDVRQCQGRRQKRRRPQILSRLLRS